MTELEDMKEKMLEFETREVELEAELTSLWEEKRQLRIAIRDHPDRN